MAVSKSTTDTTNRAGGLAYSLSPKHQLAQLAATGTLDGNAFASKDGSLAKILELAQAIDDPAYLARLALYAREKAFMKDMPAALMLILSKRSTELFHQVFDRVIDNGRVLRTFFTMLRSGEYGRKSLSYSLQRAFQRWFQNASVGSLLSASIGDKPSLRDVLRLARPTPRDNARRALYGWLAAQPVERWAPATADDLPKEIRALVAFRAAETGDEQLEILEEYRFRWDLLADSVKDVCVWKAIARQMGPMALRMNLNTLKRHGVLDDPTLVVEVSQRLQDADEIRASRQFPYQYYAAWANATEVPGAIREALHAAAEIACGNVPQLPGPVVIGLDVSGSMSSSVMSKGAGHVSKIRCIDVAAVFAAAILRRNPDSAIVPFDTGAHSTAIDPNTSILSLAGTLAAYGGGGTDCSIPLKHANSTLKNRAFSGCIVVSDNESWVGEGRRQSTATLTQWDGFIKNQRRLQGGAYSAPKLVCIDINPHGTAQAPERADILNVGGFSDAVFSMVSAFMDDREGRFVAEVEAMVI